MGNFDERQWGISVSAVTDDIVRHVLRECRVSKFVANADALISTFPLVSSKWRTVLPHFRGESWNHTCVQCLGSRVVTCWPSGRVPWRVAEHRRL